jgi:hypothetical protein
VSGFSRAADFGRWATSTSRCEWQRGRSTLRHECHGLRFEQHRAGQLNVRFLADGLGAPAALEQLVFSGVLEPGQEGMRCGGDGRCQPSWPTRMTVATVADARFDGRGLAIGLPRTQLARGQCQLERTGVRCQARGRGGETWMAEAGLTGQPQLTGDARR